MSLPKTFRAAMLPAATKPLEVRELNLALPGRDEVLVKVLACSVCHSDVAVQDGHLPNQWPIVPGHEIVGDVVAVGEGVTQYSVGDRLGAGWHGGHCSTCTQCLQGQFNVCQTMEINGVTRDGGFAEYCLLRTNCVVRVPRDLDPAEVAPLLCAGITVFNGIRKMGIEQGKTVAVQGLGGLGHLAVQYSRAMGYRTVAISRGQDKRAFAEQLGAAEYIDSESEDVVARLQGMGGAALIVATAPSAAAISPLVQGVQAMGKLLVLAPVGPIMIDSVAMVMKAVSVHGWPSGAVLDKEETIKFSRDNGIKCLVERTTLDGVDEAMNEARAGKPRFKKVIVME